ncbi:MAG: hypothetical protein HYZ63_01835 [Candidatus Andersenbacteria bacterium]|nr:hypothetical protein [Candidatus Andersenbacteria bacterium]
MHSKFFQAFVSILTSAALLVVPSVAAAQADEFSRENMPAELADQSSYRKINPLPLAYVSDIQTSLSPNGIVTGSFVATSAEQGGLGDLQYELLLLQPLPQAEVNSFIINDGVVYDRLLVKEPFALSAKEKKTISFTYQPPALGAGTYRLRVQLLTSNDRKLGWNDAAVHLTAEGVFALLETDSVLVQSIDPITRVAQDTWEPLEGPNVAAQEPITLKLFATNAGIAPLTGTLNIETERILMAEDKLTQKTGEAITLAAKESKDIRIPITAASEPGAYRVLVSLHGSNGQRISSIGEFRYVVEGASASIVSQTAVSLPEKKGQTAEVHFTVAGSADRVTPINGVLEVSLKDEHGELGNVRNTISIPSALPVQGVANISLVKNRCGTPSITSTLRTQDGQILDTYTASYPGLKSNACGAAALLSNPALMIAIAVLVAAVIITLLVMAIRGRGRSTVALVVVMGVVAAGLYLSQIAEANGIQYVYHQDDPNNPNEQVRPELYIAYPMHNSEITSLQVPYAARFSWINCDNAIARGFMRVHIKGAPGQVDWFEGLPWIAPLEKYIEIPRTCKCDSRPRRTVDISGTLQLPDMPAGLTTTLWTYGSSQGSWRGGALIHDFTWLTFKPDIDLKVEMAGPAQAAAGEQVTYVATLANLSTFMADDVKGSVQMADGFVFDPANSSGGCQASGATIECNVGGVLAGTTRTFSVAGRYGATSQCGATLKNTVDLSSSSRDPNPANNRAEAVTAFSCTQIPPDGPGGDPNPPVPPVPGVDAGITVAAPATVEQGSVLNYSLGVKNFGSEKALGTKVAVTIPPNFTFNTASSSGACTVQGSRVECNLETLSAGQSTPLAVAFTVGSAATCNSKATATATITTTSEDKNTANNSATSNETTITCGQCRDGKDNDGDGKTDDADPACHVNNDINKPYDPTRTTENDTQCTDGKDNDNDTFVDADDAGCHQDNDLNKPYNPADDNEKVTTQFDPGGFRVVE